MKDYRKPPGLKDKIKKSLGMKVRQKYESIPLLSEEEIREKYKEWPDASIRISEFQKAVRDNLQKGRY